MSSKDSSKKFIIAFIVIVLIVAIVFIVKSFADKNSKNNSENLSANNVARLAVESNNSTNNEKLNEVNNRIENIMSNSSPDEKTSEEEISSYSSPLKSSPEGRLTNIRITCGKLNGSTVSVGDTFSFCNSVGPSTAEEGYKEASVFLDGKTVQALGGGNCQVSSTLYNAVLAVDGLEVVERHEHGKDVSYVPDGKDAAVAYGSIDFRFKNNTGNTIKMYLSSDDKNVSVRIVKLV